METSEICDRVQSDLVRRYYDVVVGKLKTYTPLGAEVNRKKGAIEQYLFYETWLIDALNQNLPKRIRASKGLIVRPGSEQRSGDCDIIIYSPPAIHNVSQLAIVDAERVVAEVEVVGQLEDPSNEDIIRYDQELGLLTRYLGIIAYFGNRDKKPKWERLGVQVFLLSDGYPRVQKPIIHGEFERLLQWLATRPVHG